jgi:hypothetical protein
VKSKSVLFLLAANALLGVAACDRTGQKQAEQGAIQLPGERPATNAGLNLPPDEWAGPAGNHSVSRPAQAASVP